MPSMDTSSTSASAPRSVSGISFSVVSSGSVMGSSSVVGVALQVSDGAQLGGRVDGLGPARRTQLAQDVADVELRGGLGDEEAATDVTVGAALRQQRQDL